MKPESRFITSVNGKIPKVVHREKMHNVYRGGTFDAWYSGPKADLWIEYKWIGRIPRKGRVVPDLSPLQLRWGRGRRAEGRRAFVVVGCPEGAVLLTSPVKWEAGVSVEEFRRALVTKATLAAWITALAGGTKDAAGKEAEGDGPGDDGRVQDPDRRAVDLRTAEAPRPEAPHRGLGGD